jgi:hypothetical protein
MVEEQQARYNRRKIIVASLFFLPYFIFLMRAGIRKALPPALYLPVISFGYLTFAYFAGNAILRWMAKRWP